MDENDIAFHGNLTWLCPDSTKTRQQDVYKRQVCMLFTGRFNELTPAALYDLIRSLVLDCPLSPLQEKQFIALSYIRLPRILAAIDVYKRQVQPLTGSCTAIPVSFCEHFIFIC